MTFKTIKTIKRQLHRCNKQEEPAQPKADVIPNSEPAISSNGGSTYSQPSEPIRQKEEQKVEKVKGENILPDWLRNRFK